ncbi:PAS-domain containing protein [Azospirillum sp.]|uniref:PAS-domain containing protein n=1 Tax=Azospirillum sp. TaxID=34012 RepID=UPI002D337141|nr:PAS-domain containing protein [Azospirillum sp.]HYD68867.1 PAS-domain containing protein [Azospirillum sp.]
MQGEGEDDAARRLALLQAGLDHIDQGFTVIDADLRLVGWNERFLSLLEFPAAMARVGTPFADFMRFNAERGEYGPGDVETLVAERVRAAAEFRPHAFERERPNGRIIAVRGTPLPGRGFVTIYTDVTEQRRHERLILERNEELDRRVRERTAELESTRERLRLITDAVPANIAYIDRGGVYRFANRGYADWFGHTKDSILGRTVEEVLGPALFAVIGHQLERAATGRRVSYEYTMEQPGRGRVHAHSDIVPEYDEAGAVVGFFVLSSDVTEQKRTETALIHAQKMEAVGKLTGGLAHDFNNLLTIVIGNLAALRDRLDGRFEGGVADAEAVRDGLEPALRAARRGADITRRLLAFSRRQPLEPRPVEVDRLVRGTVGLLQRSLPPAIAIRVEDPATPPVAEVDPHQLENALLNLAFNARDAMPGGGCLTFATDTVELDPPAAGEAEVAPGAYVRITVADTGLGMDEATLEQAFEPFFTSKGLGAGSGLGLSQVYGFVKQSGGGIRMDSAPGAGTTATLLLPLSHRAVVPPGPKPAAPAPCASGERRLVLLVEDDAEVRRVIRRQLVDLGHLVVEADSGAEAARLLDAAPEVAVLVSDVMMPGGLGGRELAALARAKRPDLRVVLISGYADGMEGGDTPILHKPFTRDDLAAAIGAAAIGAAIAEARV